eukprot:TRINITY_DN106263_c0_g1_i1.p1 TRINITY_DN106263_c0_g1~~TRINITY_DN106263_c0_g1_i1.p1  ORF type:complete len:1048 (-),score=197.48 TRINITY_DN106263_c0_g1_i1:76-3219(-)
MQAVIEGLSSLLLLRSQDVLTIGNDLLSSFVAVTGDAHQAKVAQDLFRQEVRYERSLQIREDIRDVNKCMMESVQTHVIMGSIILGVCFSMSVEGWKGHVSDRLSDDLWLIFTHWSITFTLIALWLALRFQMKISGSARERLLRRHRFMVPDDLVVGKMGGDNLVNHMASFHNWFLHTMEDMVTAQTDAETLTEKYNPVFISQPSAKKGSPLRVPVEGLNDRIDATPMLKHTHAWMHPSGEGYSQITTLDVPYFLLAETCVRMPWLISEGQPALRMRVFGKATLYVSAQSAQVSGGTQKPYQAKGQAAPTGSVGIRKAFRLDSNVPAWPPDELPVVRTGYHENWRGESGYGEFRRVEGFSIFVDTKQAMELPLYKIVLANPADYGMEYIDVTIQWNFRTTCEALTLVLRRGHVHCKEEDFPLTEFNSEIKQMLPLRRYAGQFLAEGTSCLLVAIFLLFVQLQYQHEQMAWGFEVAIAGIALLPGILLMYLMPVERKREAGVVQVVARVSEINNKEPQVSRFSRLQRSLSRQLYLRKGRSQEDLEDPLEQNQGRSTASLARQNSGDSATFSDTTVDVGQADALAKRLAERAGGVSNSHGAEAADVEAGTSAPVVLRNVPAFSPLSMVCCPTPQSASCREVIQATSSKISSTASSCATALQIQPPISPEPAPAIEITEQHRRHSKVSDPPMPVKPLDIEPTTLTQKVKSGFEATLSDLRRGWDREKSLQALTLLLHILCAFSLLSAIAAKVGMGLVDGGDNTVTAESPEAVLHWKAWATEWPPFFKPMAIALSGDGSDSLLFAASGGILQKFSAEADGFPLRAIGPAMVLPGSVRGLGVVQQQLAAVAEEGFFDVRSLDPSWGSASSEALSGPLGVLASGVVVVDAQPWAQLPWQVGTLAAAALSISETGSSSTGVILASSTGALYLCRAPSFAVGGDVAMDILAELAPGQRLEEVRGIHLCRRGCAASEAVLWAAAATGKVWAIGLESGQILAKFQSQLPSTSSGSSIVALTGNSTHLVAAASLQSQEAVLVVTPYPALPDATEASEL